MAKVQTRYGIPDLELACANGGTFNPATFVGHHLIVLFLPAEESEAIQEVRSYHDRAKHLSDSDAWLLPVAPTPEPPPQLVAACHALAVDPAGRAWEAFERILELPPSHKRGAGAVYLFGRGGRLQRAWFGTGHLEEVVRELRRDGW